MSNIMRLIKPFLLKRKKLYVLMRSLRELNNAEIYKLLIGYYESDSDVISLVLENTSNFLTKAVVYDISLGELLSLL